MSAESACRTCSVAVAWNVRENDLLRLLVKPRKDVEAARNDDRPEWECAVEEETIREGSIWCIGK